MVDYLSRAGARGAEPMRGADAACGRSAAASAGSRAAAPGARRSCCRAGRFWLRAAPRRRPCPSSRAARRAARSRAPAPRLLALLEALDAAARDPRVDGVLLRLRGAPASLAQGLALRRALAALRAAGKPVAVYARAARAAEELFLASARRRASACPRRAASRWSACASRRFFLRDLLDRLGVRADVVRVGEHKTAAERLMRRGMSRERSASSSRRCSTTSTTSLVEGIAEGRGLDAGAGARSSSTAGRIAPRAAREAGLVDACLFPDEVEAALAELAGRPGAGGRASPRSRPTPALRARDPGLRAPLRERPRIAYVVARASCASGGGPLAASASDGYRALLRRLELDARAVRASCSASRAPAATRSPRTCCGARSAASPRRSRWWRSLGRGRGVGRLLPGLGGRRDLRRERRRSPARSASSAASSTSRGCIASSASRATASSAARAPGCSRASRALTPDERAALRARHARGLRAVPRAGRGGPAHDPRRRAQRSRAGASGAGARALARGPRRRARRPARGARRGAARAPRSARGARARVDVLPRSPAFAGLGGWLLRRGTAL